MRYCCPNCNEVIYDRTGESCLRCGAPLPVDSFLSLPERESMSRHAVEEEQAQKRGREEREVIEQQRQENESS